MYHVTAIVVALFAVVADFAVRARIVDYREGHYNSEYGHPGIKLRLTRRGADHVKEVGVRLLNEQLARLRGFRAAHPFASPTGLSGHIYLSDVETLAYQPPARSAIAFAPPNQLVFDVEEMGITLRGRFIGVSGPFQVPGRVHGRLDSLRLRLSVAISVDVAIGQTNVRVADCSSAVRQTQFTLDPEGPLGGVVKTFEAQINDLIRERIPNLLCRGLESIVERNAPALFQRLARADLAPHFITFNGTGVIDRFISRFTDGLYIDGRSMANPIVTVDYFETQQRGELRYDNGAALPPFYPRPIPPDADSERMLYLYGSDYTLNSLLYHAYHTDRLTLKIEEATLPYPYRGFVRTSCDGGAVSSAAGNFLGLCVGKLIPALGEQFPNSTTKFIILPHNLPEVRFVDGVSSMNVRTRILSYVAANDSVPAGHDRQVLVSSADGVADIRLAAEQERFAGDLKLRKLNVRLHRSAIDGIDPESISQLAPLAKTFLGPQLSQGLKQGFPFPLKDTIRFIRPELAIHEGFVRLGTDFELSEDRFRDKVQEAFERLKNST